jgi:hypothetical protein
MLKAVEGSGGISKLELGQLWTNGKGCHNQQLTQHQPTRAFKITLISWGLNKLCFLHRRPLLTTGGHTDELQ